MADSSSQPRRWHAAVRIAIGVVAALVLAEGGWLTLFSWASHSGRLEGWLNRRPDKVVVSYESVASRWPGRFVLRGLVVRGRTARALNWEVTVGRASVQLDLAALLVRTVSVRSAELDGVEVRSLSAHLPDLPQAANPAALRPMPSRAQGPAPSSAARSRSANRKSTWKFRFHGLAVHDLREVHLDSTRFVGQMHGEVGFSVDTGSGRAEVQASRLEVTAMSISHDGAEVGRQLTGAIDLALDEYRYKEERGRALVPHASGRIELRGELDDRPIVSELVRRVDWIEIEPGVAPLEADLRFRRGRLLAGSRLVAVRTGSHLRLLDFEIEGANALALEVGKSARWELRFAHFKLRRGAAREPFLTGTGLALVGTVTAPELSDLAQRAEIRLELGSALLPDLDFLRDWLPPASGIGRLTGKARASGTIGARVADRKPFGEVDFEFDAVELEWSGLPFAGKVGGKLVIAGGDLTEQRLELDGTRLALDNFSAPTLVAPGAAPAPGWWMRFELKKGSIELGPPVAVGGNFELRLRDTAPLVAIFETRRDLPGWVEKLLSAQDVRASGRFRGRPGDLRLDELETGLLGGRLTARLHFAGDERRGKLLLAWRRLAVGIGFNGSEREIHLRAARAWYDQEE